MNDSPATPAPLPAGALELDLPSALSFLGIVREAVAVFTVSVRADLSDRVELPVVEAVTNAIQHANHQDPQRRVVVRFSRDRDWLAVSVRDDGEAFEPPPASGPPAELATSGRGLFLMRSMADEVAVDHAEGHNRVVLRWRLVTD